MIVPVKDAPSLENCRHIYEFFDSHSLSRRPLRVLPCLVDARIHFDGPFRDPYQLLKAYAINRGYRCLEGYIAKSPKVESLNTNPEGKIYPVLTHGRQTDVHVQLAHVARQVYLDTLEQDRRRLDEIRLGQNREEKAPAERFPRAARAPSSPGCLVCGTAAGRATSRSRPPATLPSASDQLNVAGFIEEECFAGLAVPLFLRSQTHHRTGRIALGSVSRIGPALLLRAAPGPAHAQLLPAAALVLPV